MDRAGFPFVLYPLAAAGVCAMFGLWAATGVALLLGGGLALFFRDPDRREPDGLGDDAVLAPADGRVLHAGDADDAVAPAGEWRQVSIFLSPLDVHVNRTPVGGRIVDVAYAPGRFLPAYDPRAAAQNERAEVRVEHGGQTVVFRQVVGVLARRVVCRVTPGMQVARGQRFGIMKFGSRMDVFLPAASTVETSVGDVVRGGETVIARLLPMS